MHSKALPLSRTSSDSILLRVNDVRRDGTTFVLVVDDEQIIADTLVLILNQFGFDARAEYDGQNAVVLARALKPDVLISDVLMEGMNGIELAIQVCKELPNCRIVLISGLAAIPDLLHDAEEDGYHFNFLQKPFRPEELLNYLRDSA